MHTYRARYRLKGSRYRRCNLEYRIFPRALRSRPRDLRRIDLRACTIGMALVPWISNGYPRFCRTSKRAVLEENDQQEGRRKRTTAPPVVVTQVIRRDYDQIPEPVIRRRTMEHALNSRLSPKVTPITDDYEISNHVLGLGINGKVVQCYNKITRQKYALKVSLKVSLQVRIGHQDSRDAIASRAKCISLSVGRCCLYTVPFVRTITFL